MASFGAHLAALDSAKGGGSSPAPSSNDNLSNSSFTDGASQRSVTTFGGDVAKPKVVTSGTLDPAAVTQNHHHPSTTGPLQVSFVEDGNSENVNNNGGAILGAAPSFGSPKELSGTHKQKKEGVSNIDVGSEDEQSDHEPAVNNTNESYDGAGSVELEGSLRRSKKDIEDGVERMEKDDRHHSYNPSRTDLLALITMQKEMMNSRDAREDLKTRIEEAAYLVVNHHSNHALENVTLSRECESLAEAIQNKEDVVRSLETDLKYASEEQRRLVELNDSLLQGIREKEREKERVKAKLQAFAESEKRMVKATDKIVDSTSTIERQERFLSINQKVFAGKTGNHHAGQMRLEQTMLDLTLESESLKKRILQLTGAPPEPKEGWERPNYEHLFRPCVNPECVKVRKQSYELKNRVETLQRLSDQAKKDAALAARKNSASINSRGSKRFLLSSPKNSSVKSTSLMQSSFNQASSMSSSTTSTDWLDGRW